MLHAVVGVYLFAIPVILAVDIAGRDIEDGVGVPVPHTGAAVAAAFGLEEGGFAATAGTVLPMK
jgi:hypothetical protein